MSGTRRKLRDIESRDNIDPFARQTMERLVSFFGCAVSTLINIVDPDIIVIGGGVGNVDKIYTEGAQAASNRIFSPTMKTRIVKPMLGDSAGVFGAAHLTAVLPGS
jgi:predicted NBD/HSP70 family sugar kinase